MFMFSYFMSASVAASFSLGSWRCQASTTEQDHGGTRQGGKKSLLKKA